MTQEFENMLEENHFTPRAQQVLALAQKEADRFNHNFVGTEHLLLGIIKLGQGVACNVLQRLDINLETVRQEVEKLVGTGPDQRMPGGILYTPRIKKVLSIAAKEAKALNHTYVGTEHLLLGLLREGDGVAGRVLRNLNADIEAVREQVLKELDPNFGDTAEGGVEVQPRNRLRFPLEAPGIALDRILERFLNQEVVLTGPGVTAKLPLKNVEQVAISVAGHSVKISPRIAACLLILGAEKGPQEKRLRELLDRLTNNEGA